MHSTRLFSGLLAGCLCLLAVGQTARAQDGPSSFVFDLPVQPNLAVPSWLAQPEVSPTHFAELNLPITPPEPGASMLVTVFFQEKDGGFLRLSWQSATEAQILSENFYEGIGISNQRSLLVSPATLAGGGKLCLQSGDSTLGIRRIKLEWLEKKTSLVSPEMPDLLVTPATGRTQDAEKFDGQSAIPDPGAWRGRIVTVPITDAPMRIEQGVEFDIQLDGVPASGRLALKESGLPWGKHLVVWINRQRAGTITPSVPDLLDDGFLTDSPKIYTGWRDGTFYAPAAFFKAGINAVQFSDEDDLPPANDAAATEPKPLALKEVVLQLGYPSAPLVPDATPAPDQSTVSDPDPALTPGVFSAPETVSPEVGSPENLPAPPLHLDVPAAPVGPQPPPTLTSPITTTP